MLLLTFEDTTTIVWAILKKIINGVLKKLFSFSVVEKAIIGDEYTRDNWEV